MCRKEGKWPLLVLSSRSVLAGQLLSWLHAADNAEL